MQISRRGAMAVGAAVIGAAFPIRRLAAEDGNGPAVGLGFSLYGMKSHSFAEALAACQEIGYDCVEIPVMADWPGNPEVLPAHARKDLQKGLKNSDLRLSSLMENLPLLAEGGGHQKNLERLRRAAELGRELAPEKPPLIETVLGGKPDQWDAVKGTMAERLRDWAKVGEASGVVIAIKPHVAGALHLPADAAWLMKEIDSKYLRVVFDHSHFELRGLALSGCIAELFAYTAFIHVKDARGDAKKFEFLLPGEIDEHLSGYFANLRGRKYAGDIVAEVSGQIHQKPGYDPVAAARKCYGPLAAAMREAGMKRA